MEVSIHAEMLKAQAISTQLGQVYGRGPRTGLLPGLDAVAAAPSSSKFEGDGVVVSLSYKSLDISISDEPGEAPAPEEGEPRTAGVRGEGTDGELKIDPQYTPDAVSTRIVDFVKALFAQYQDGNPEGDISAFASEIARGVEEGFAEAREILESVRMMTDSISKLVGDTYSLTVGKLSDFFESLGVVVDGLFALADQNAQPEESQTVA
ncbi:MAG: DUF5610 domain-containing protein [Nitrospirae bacterium]|nr:DUF5610 domain-containing protein [Nitrospirota bacterium]